MKKLKVLTRITKEGRTYLPKVYEIVAGNDATNDQITERMAAILQADYGAWVSPVGDKPTPTETENKPQQQQRRRK